MFTDSKNWQPIIFAVFLAIVQILWLKELFQFLIASLIGVELSEISFNFILLNFYFEPTPGTSMPILFLLYFSPIIYLVLCTETTSLFLRKTPAGVYRFFIIVFVLIILGFLIIHIFYNAVLLILNPGLTNDWITLAIYLRLDEVGRMILAFGVIFLFVFYLNMQGRRVTNYIN